MRKAICVITTVCLFISVLMVVSLTWVGAEYIFEGKVLPSKVDGFFAIALACYVTRDCIYTSKRLYGGGKRDNSRTRS